MIQKATGPVLAGAVPPLLDTVLFALQGRGCGHCQGQRPAAGDELRKQGGCPDCSRSFPPGFRDILAFCVGFSGAPEGGHPTLTRELCFYGSSLVHFQKIVCTQKNWIRELIHK